MVRAENRSVKALLTIIQHVEGLLSGGERTAIEGQHLGELNDDVPLSNSRVR